MPCVKRAHEFGSPRIARDKVDNCGKLGRSVLLRTSRLALANLILFLNLEEHASMHGRLGGVAHLSHVVGVGWDIDSPNPFPRLSCVPPHVVHKFRCTRGWCGEQPLIPIHKLPARRHVREPTQDRIEPTTPGSIISKPIQFFRYVRG